MADPTKKRYKLRLTVAVDRTLKAMLEQLAQEEQCSEAQIVRSMVNARFGHRFTNSPMCSTSQHCLCPQMHLVRPTRQETREDALIRLRGDVATYNRDNPPDRVV